MMVFKSPVSVHLMLFKNHEILLSKRKNTGFCDGFYSFPVGKLEDCESVLAAMKREAKEEINIDLLDLEIVQVMNRLGEDINRVDYFFIAEAYEGTIQNNEPDKCSELKWFDVDNLPMEIIPYIREAILNYRNNIRFSLYGWGDVNEK